MQKSEFISKMADYAQIYGDVAFQEVDRSDRHYYGMFIKKDCMPTPVADLDYIYSKYVDGAWDMSDCTDYLDSIFTRKMEMPVDTSDVINWGWAQSRLYFRLLGTAGSGINREVEDMYLIPYIQLTSDDSAAIRVTDKLIHIWGVTVDDVFAAAETNQNVLRPVNIRNISEVLGMSDEEFPIYIVSNSIGSFGASAILYPGVADKLHSILNGDFYVLPSSVHEMIAIPKCAEFSINTLAEMVASINRTSVADCDRLTDSIYTYDFTHNTLKLVG